MFLFFPVPEIWKTALTSLIGLATLIGIMTRPFRWNEAIIAMVGAAVLILLGLISPADAFLTLIRDWNTFLFFLGMMGLSALAEAAGLFDWLAVQAAKLAGQSAARLFLNVFLLGALISMILSNDATALILTPIVYLLVTNLPVLPYLFACTFIADTASFLLPISNPINIIVLSRFPLDLWTFLRLLLLPSLVVIALIDRNFAGKAESIDEAPEPFRQSLRDQIKPNEAVSLLVYSPVFKSAGRRFDATVLVITNERWLMLAEEENGKVKVSGASFDDTLLVELTEILLFGQMKIDFVSNGKPCSSALQFDIVEEEMYREAAHLILDAIEGVTPLANEEAFRNAVGYVFDWPLKFRHGVLKFMPKGRQLIFATHWPALVGGFRRELAPAAALALTEREIFLISEDKASGWFSRRKAPKYGYIVTYLPRVRLAQHRISRQAKFALLELETHGSHGGEVLQIMLPLQYESEVVECMDHASAVAA